MMLFHRWQLYSKKLIIKAVPVNSTGFTDDPLVRPWFLLKWETIYIFGKKFSLILILSRISAVACITIQQMKLNNTIYSDGEEKN